MKFNVTSKGNIPSPLVSPNRKAHHGEARTNPQRSCQRGTHPIPIVYKAPRSAEAGAFAQLGQDPSRLDTLKHGVLRMEAEQEPRVVFCACALLYMFRTTHGSI